MINKKNHKSRELNNPGTGAGGRQFPFYGFLGLAVMAAGEVLLFSGNHFVGLYFTPIQWTGYIFFMDALIKRVKGCSLISCHLREFLLLLVISIVSWLIFEAYNLLLHNWRYLGLPESRLLRYIGYAWSFATISPGIFLTYEMAGLFWPEEAAVSATVEPLKRTTFSVLVILGLVALVVPLLWPSTYMTPLVWIGFVLFLDPINGRIGERSIMAELFSRRFRPLLQFFAAGLVCGFLWEFWNFWAHAKWEYSVPYFGDVKLFEMPVMGFLGFLPFTVECFAIYKFIRRMIPIPLKEHYLG